jgi:hypothetical protein
MPTKTEVEIWKDEEVTRELFSRIDEFIMRTVEDMTLGGSIQCPHTAKMYARQVGYIEALKHIISADLVTTNEEEESNDR